MSFGVFRWALLFVGCRGFGVLLAPRNVHAVAQVFTRLTIPKSQELQSKLSCCMSILQFVGFAMHMATHQL